ncbi:MAG: hypothetical protein JXP34_00390 [Planctomycetes bacterium]|nr:hypothetical protein [Planctomycetota bacterium]
MKGSRILRAFLGLALLAAGAAGAFLALEHAMREKGGLAPTLRRCFRAAWQGGAIVRVSFSETGDLHSGSRVFERSAERMDVVGTVREVRPDEVVLELSRTSASRAGPATVFTLVRGSGTAAWIASRLLTRERVEEILAEWQAESAVWEDAFSTEIEPLAREALTDGIRVLLDALPEVAGARSDRWQALIDGPGRRILEERIEPVLTEEVWPLVRVRATPEIEGLGRELWSRLPLWSMGIRWLWQILPGTRDDLVEETWRRFLSEEALPAVEARLPRWGEILQATVEEVLARPPVRQAMERAALEFIREPELLEILRESAADLASRVGETLERHYRAPEAQAALRRFADRVQPTINATLNRLFLDKSGTGINPDLAWVLRDQFLQKDRTWVLIQPDPAGAPARSFRGDVFHE